MKYVYGFIEQSCVFSTIDIHTLGAYFGASGFFTALIKCAVVFIRLFFMGQRLCIGLQYFISKLVLKGMLICRNESSMEYVVMCLAKFKVTGAARE